MDAESEDLEARMAVEEQEHRKNPKRTRLIKVTGRDPKEVAKILSTLFGQTADVALDERTGSVLITINRAKTWAEVQFLLGEIEGTAARLEQESSTSATRSPTTPTDALMLGPGIAEAPPRNSLYSEQDHEARQIALQLRTAAPADQPALRVKLERLTEQQFRTRQELRKKEIDDLGKRIDQLRVTHLRRQQNQAEIIRRRVEELLDPNNDLRWEQSPTNTEIPADVSSLKGEEPTKIEEPSGATIEQTYDGIGYSQWLKMLETEVKPTKLAAAMEACSRLAASADRSRIAKLIIQKASQFEAANIQERSEVWDVAFPSLARLPMTDITDAILISLAEPEASERGRTFQGRFILNMVFQNPKVMARQDRMLIAGLINAVQENNKDRNCLLAAACQLWEVSDHKLEDFEGFKPLIMEQLDGAAKATERFDNDRYIVIRSLVMKNPETPDLALTLMTVAKNPAISYEFARVIALVGAMGRHGEPAVPVIIEQILAELKLLDENANNANILAISRDRTDRARRFVHALGQIGVGAKAAKFLKELCLISTSHGESSIPSDISQEARNALEKFAQAPDSDGPPILSDEFLVRGVWQLQSLNFEIQSGYEAWIARGIVNLGRVQNGIVSSVSIVLNKQLIGGHLKLDPTKMPKEVVLSMPGLTSREPERNGIYELTETTLKIYLAPPDKPGPETMIQDGAEIPEGYSLVELRRSPSIPPHP